jgi:hypothetical protein
MTLKDFLTTMESMVYDDPSEAAKKQMSYFDIAKKSFKAIGREQEELEAEAKLEQVEDTTPRRQLGELEFVDEFVATLEKEKVGFTERTLEIIKEEEMTPYELRQMRLMKEKEEAEQKAK